MVGYRVYIYVQIELSMLQREPESRVFELSKASACEEVPESYILYQLPSQVPTGVTERSLASQDESQTVSDSIHSGSTL